MNNIIWPYTWIGRKLFLCEEAAKCEQFIILTRCRLVTKHGSSQV
jgi:hypothetical protein